MRVLTGKELPDKLLDHYLKRLVGRFYKILPIKENNEDTLNSYMVSFQDELIGLNNVVELLHNDESYLSLIAILQYLIDHDCDICDVRREVFNAISICKSLRKRHCGAEV